jgi:uncharacterized OB-fold protein
MTAPRFDLPMVENENEPFWTAVDDGRLLVGRCGACGRHHYYPRPHCPSCWSDDVEWVDASGAATLYTWSVIHTNDLPPWPGRVPYIAAVVELAEGPRMMTQIVGAEGDDLSIGMALEMEFVDLDDELTIAAFHPA